MACTFISNIAVLFVILPLCFGNDDFNSRTLMDRIEALERRDQEQSASIKVLEEEVKVSNYKLHHMSTYIGDLQKENATKSKKQEEQNNVIAALQKDLKLQQSITERNTWKFNILSDKLRKTDRRLEKMDNTVSGLNSSCLPKLNEVKTTLTKADEHGHKFKQVNEIEPSTETKNREKSFSSSSQSSSRNVDQPSDNTDKLFTSEVYNNKSDAMPKDLNLATGDEFQTTVTEPRKQLQQLTRSVDSTDVVAFLAVHSQQAIQHLGINEEIRFDDVILNQGNGYHNDHGLFIAPKEGFYLFSSTITCYNDAGHNEVQATIRKNGAQLARIFSQGIEHQLAAQGSVTVVTYMNVGDEAWVSFDWPAGGEIWGNGFTSFTGILVK